LLPKSSDKTMADIRRDAMRRLPLKGKWINRRKQRKQRMNALQLRRNSP